MMKIGMIQDTAAADAEENLKKIKTYAQKAQENNCQVLCFPEAFLTGYHPECVREYALERESSMVWRISEIAVDGQMDLLVGFMEKDGQQNYLTHGVFCADGRKEFYRKTHLGMKEQQYFAVGNQLPVFQLTNGVKIGFQMCVECHFPEITQSLSLKGAEIVFAPHAVPRAAGSRQKVWNRIIPARSYDNRIYMACCNLWDEERFGGGILVTAPDGETVAEYYDETAALIAVSVEPEMIQNYHQVKESKRYRYYPGWRRTELYDR